MRRLIPALLPMLSLLSLGGCAERQSNRERDNAELRAQVEALEIEGNRLRNEPEFLFSKAHYEKDEDKYDSALATLEKLRQNYPDFQPDRVSTALEVLSNVVDEDSGSVML